MAGKTFDQNEADGTTINKNQKPPTLVPPLFGLGTIKDAGVEGESFSKNSPGVLGSNSDVGGDGILGESPKGVGVHARGGTLAGLFEGSVQITGDAEVIGTLNLTGPTSDIVLRNEDCAEQFNVCAGATIVPGTVMVLGDDGLLRASRFAYDKRVAGVVSGAGKFRPAMTLGVTPSIHQRAPIALFGKVYCWADADLKPIEAGDLLTSSPTEGHAMVATEPARAFGTVIGKALEPLAFGKGLIPILVALQ